MHGSEQLCRTLPHQFGMTALVRFFAISRENLRDPILGNLAALGNRLAAHAIVPVSHDGDLEAGHPFHSQFLMAQARALAAP